MMSRFRCRFSVLTFLIGIVGVLVAVSCSTTPDSEPQNTPQSNQQSNQPPSGNFLSSDDACDAFENAGLPTSVTSTGINTFFAQGNFSRANPPGEVGQIAEFFQSAIEDALQRDAPIGCYWALNLTQQGDLGGRALWLSLDLPNTPSVEQVQDIHDELASRGATLFGFTNTQAAGNTPLTIVIGDIPVGTAATVGGTIVFSGSNAVIVVASSDLPRGVAPSASSPIGPGAPPSAANTPRPTIAPQLPSGGQTISDWFKESIEDALGVTLNIENAFQGSAGGQNTLLISFQIAEGSAAPDNVGGRFSGIVNSAGAKITSSLNLTGIAIVNFENLSVGGVTGMGSLTFNEEQNTILVSLQY